MSDRTAEQFLRDSPAWGLLLEFIDQERFGWSEDHRVAALPEMSDLSYTRGLFLRARRTKDKFIDAITRSCMEEPSVDMGLL